MGGVNRWGWAQWWAATWWVLAGTVGIAALTNLKRAADLAEGAGVRPLANGMIALTVSLACALVAAAPVIWRALPPARPPAPHTDGSLHQ